MIYINVPLTRYNFPIVYGPKTVFYDLPNGTDRKLVVSNRINLCVLDMTGGERRGAEDRIAWKERHKSAKF